MSEKPKGDIIGTNLENGKPIIHKNEEGVHIFENLNPSEDKIEPIIKPRVQTHAEYVEIQKAHKEAINEDIQRTIDKIKQIFKKGTKDPQKPR